VVVVVVLVVEVAVVLAPPPPLPELVDSDCWPSTSSTQADDARLASTLARAIGRRIGRC